MNIFVCIKQVPDTAQSVKIAPDGTTIVYEGVEMVIGPYDEFALEEALRLKEKVGGTVTLVTVGPERCQKALRTGYAVGADEAVHLSDPLFEGSDPVAVARILAAYFKTQKPEVIWAGKQAVDDDSSIVPQALSELLGMPVVTSVKSVEIESGAARAVVARETEDGVETLECPLPAVLAMTKGANALRHQSLKLMVASKKKAIKVLGAADLGLSAGTVGPAAARWRVRKLAPPPARQGKVRMIEGDAATQAREAVRILREELKLI